MFLPGLPPIQLPDTTTHGTRIGRWGTWPAEIIKRYDGEPEPETPSEPWAPDVKS
jgi:hypothetical protein